MKDRKIKTWLTTVSIAAIFVTLIMYLVAVLTEASPIAGEDPLFYKWIDVGASGHYVMDWNYSAIFLVLLLIALGAWLAKMIVFTVPSVKDKLHNASIELFCDILVITGLVFAIIALFLPINLEMGFEYDVNEEPSRITACRVLGLIGSPLSFISGLGTVGLTFKSGK